MSVTVYHSTGQNTQKDLNLHSNWTTKTSESCNSASDCVWNLQHVCCRPWGLIVRVAELQAEKYEYEKKKNKGEEEKDKRGEENREG